MAVDAPAWAVDALGLTPDDSDPTHRVQHLRIWTGSPEHRESRRTVDQIRSSTIDAIAAVMAASPGRLCPVDFQQVIAPQAPVSRHCGQPADDGEAAQIIDASGRCLASGLEANAEGG